MKKNKKIIIVVLLLAMVLYFWYKMKNGNGNGNGTTPPHTYNGIVQKSKAYCMKKVKGTKGCEEYWSKHVDNKTITK
tara:strand:- start:4846 stop:5076 length:231 start_codon:yes stop_codon:yes gene_type:complete